MVYLLGDAMKKYLPEYYKFEHKGKANPQAVIQGDYYRFTLLSECFVRMEYDKNGRFEDRPSSIIWNRFQEKPEFELVEDEKNLIIKTPKITLTYEKEAEFSRKSLMIKTVTNAIHGTGVYRYGFKPLINRGGTYRTLDGVDGCVPLEDGLFSEEGYTIIDDAKSLVFNKDGWFEQRDDTIDLYYFGYGQDFKQGLLDFYAVSGKTPLLPRYALGNWWSRYWEYRDDELDVLLDEFANENIPLSVCIIDMDWHKTDIDERYGNGWTGYSWNKKLFKQPKAYIDSLHVRGLKTALNLHPALGFRGHEDCYKDFAGFMNVDIEKEELIPFDPIDPKFMKGYFDYGHHPHEDIGVDFWWIDWQQGNNTSMEGVDPLYLLNHYHYMDHGRNSMRRPFIFSRWSGLGGHKYPIGFSGDTVVSWASLKFQPEFTATAANVGYGWWSHDIGGHYNGVETDELYTRWVQYGVFSPIMRLHTTKNYYTKREPWRHGYESQQIVADYMRLRHELIPYIYTINKEQSEGGLPLVMPMYYNYPHESQAYRVKDQYTFGSEMMVAPFVDPMDVKLGVSKKAVWFPQGSWFNLFTGERFEGGRTSLIYGDLAEIPVFVKAGGIIPLAVLDKDRTGSIKQGVDLPTIIDVHIFPGPDSTYLLYEDDGISNGYKEEKWAETQITTKYVDGQLRVGIQVRGDESIIPKNRQYRILLRSFLEPEEVTLRGDGTILLGQGETGQSLLRGKSHLLASLKVGSRSSDVLIKLMENYIDDSFNPVNKIIDIIDKSTFDTGYKGKLGFIYNEYQTLSGGVLGQNISSMDMISRIIALDVPVELKEMAIAILSRHQHFIQSEGAKKAMLSF